MPKPRVTFLADRPGWAFDINARGVTSQLEEYFEFRIEYVVEEPNLLEFDPDLLVVMFWGENYHHRFGFPPQKIIKQISSHRWSNEKQYGELTAVEMSQRYLSDCCACIVPSERLLQIFQPLKEVSLAPKGIDPSIFFPRTAPTGTMKVGWVGNAKDPCKGLNDILRPAVGDHFQLLIADGSLNQLQLADFYHSVDVITVASTAEGDPRPLIEAMACGCFPVAVDVGIVPELVIHGENGFIVGRSVEEFQVGFKAVEGNLEFIRSMRKEIAQPVLETRSWASVAPYWGDAFARVVLNHSR